MQQMSNELRDRCIHSLTSRGYTQKAANSIFTEIMNDLAHTLLADGKAVLPGVGTLKKYHRKARKGYDIQHGTMGEIPETIAVKFIPAKQIREALN